MHSMVLDPLWVMDGKDTQGLLRAPARDAPHVKRPLTWKDSFNGTFS